MGIEEDLREQFIRAFEGADYPVSDQMDLVPALPDGPSTRFESGDVRFSALELSAKLGNHADFPYDDVEGLVDDVIDALYETGELR
ncbi:MAG: MTH865 family protein [Halodesulfurarchaeum sp.]